MDKRIKEIFKFYGEKAQKGQIIQELAELIVGLTKNDLENIHEEIADVEIMLEQLKLFKDIDVKKIEEYKEFKIDRQIKRIKKQKEKKFTKVSTTTANEIINTRKPLGLFWTREKQWFVGIDNSTGDAWTECFKSKKECFKWLAREE
ncbi:MAG: hypothetical protein E6363_01015 [Enterobacter sp.]|uniref:hypothetical protein n=1 Tax=Clostridium perfringens TaxID=1502 RepID=UPI001A2D09CA|nr:hypothetical protein [Clostridium perfringens]MDU7016736.1 hypothetical protein [Enterobacter sp.]HAT4069829.1 hypothetical protein [Clostridium perfringens]HAT4097377.1 hypothetical protein [Clostridium perfringens]HBI6922740.1 hypothetical protein [Clostridium perfringens]